MTICPFEKKKQHEFKNDLKTGARGEAIIERWLSKQPGVVSVDDLTGIEKYQKLDIDFAVTFNTGKRVTFEVKTDTYPMKNLYYETMSNLERGTIGCFEMTGADYMLYFYEKHNRIVMMDVGRMRKWFSLYKMRLEPYRKQVVNKVGSNHYTSEGYAIPLRMIDKKEWLKILKVG